MTMRWVGPALVSALQSETQMETREELFLLWEASFWIFTSEIEIMLNTSLSVIGSCN